MQCYFASVWDRCVFVVDVVQCGRVLGSCAFPFVWAAMFRVFLCVVGLACGQTFPKGISELLAQMRSKLGEVDGMRVDNTASLRTLSKAAAGEAAAAADRAREVDALSSAVSAAARHAVAEIKFVGGCPRLLEGCPFGWSENPSGECSPPAAYNGPCAAADLSSYSSSQKEEFALKCGVGWPCRGCKTNFAGCPLGWQAVGKLCLAPDTYDGMCSPVMDFRALSGSSLARWSATCGVRWPCL